MSSCNNRELEHLIIYVVCLLCLVTIWTIRGAHRMCFNRRIRVWFIGDCWSLWNCVWFCLSDWNNLSTKHGNATKGHACWQWQKMFIIRVHGYRDWIATWYCTRISSAQCSWSLACWNTARGQHAEACSRVLTGACGSDGHSLFCALQMPCFWWCFGRIFVFWRRKLWVCELLKSKLGKFSAENTDCFEVR